MDSRERLERLNGALAALDACAGDADLEELAAELEDAIFFLECAEDGEEEADALEEIVDLADRLRAFDDAEPARIARELRRLCE